MRERLDRAGRAVPAQRADRVARRPRGVRLPGRAQDDARRLRRQGRVGRAIARPTPTRRSPPTVRCSPRSSSTSAASCRRWSPAVAVRRDACATPSSSRGRSTASAPRSSHRRPTSTRALAAEARALAERIADRARRHRHPGRRAVRDRPTDGCSSTSSRCVRTTPATGRSTAPRPASSRTTCAPSSTCRSGCTHAARSRGPSWSTCSAAPSTTSRRSARSSLAAEPDVKVHLYGKAVKAGRKVGHVTAVRRRSRRRAAPGPGAPRQLLHGRQSSS